jgi:hypothetical protein
MFGTVSVMVNAVNAGIERERRELGSQSFPAITLVHARSYFLRLASIAFLASSKVYS